jgi:hypothetical protein
MERALERGQKMEAMDPIMMDEKQNKEIMDRVGVTCSGQPYQYRINSKKRAVSEQEGLDMTSIDPTWLAVNEASVDISPNCACMRRNLTWLY